MKRAEFPFCGQEGLVKGWSTDVDGLAAYHAAPYWNLVHTASGRTVAWGKTRKQVVAIAATLAGVMDWTQPWETLVQNEAAMHKASSIAGRFNG